MRPSALIVPALITATLLVNCGTSTPSTPQENADIDPVSAERVAQLDRSFSALTAEHGLMTVGAAVIKNGTVAWTGYYGEQAPGVPASRETMFNVASITKTVTAETVLRLVEDGKLSLDESMAPYWVDPDVADDPRHIGLTPRMTLHHSTGFLNWRFFAPDRILRFENDPGSTFGYSGEGFEYVMRYAERKLERDFESLVREYVFDPIGMRGVSLSVREAIFDRIARPVDENGTFHGYYCRPNGWCRGEGDYSAADDMVVTVEDYARFMISAMRGDGLSAGLAADRNRVQMVYGEYDAVDCTTIPEHECPEAQGYGLGWEVFDYGGYKLVGHGGSDWSEVALGYFYTRSGDGLVIFLNAPNAVALGAMAGAIELLDADSPMIGLYRRWHADSAG